MNKPNPEDADLGEPLSSSNVSPQGAVVDWLCAHPDLVARLTVEELTVEMSREMFVGLVLPVAVVRHALSAMFV